MFCIFVMQSQVSDSVKQKTVMKIICLLRKCAHSYTLFFEPVLNGHSFAEGDLRMYDDAVEKFSRDTPIFDTYAEAIKYAYIHTHGEANYLLEFGEENTFYPQGTDKLPDNVNFWESLYEKEEDEYQQSLDYDLRKEELQYEWR